MAFFFSMMAQQFPPQHTLPFPLPSVDFIAEVQAHPHQTLRFRDFHRKHFRPPEHIQFFRHALRPGALPLPQFTFDETQDTGYCAGIQGNVHDVETEEGEENEGEEGIEFVLSQGAIDMFRHSELWKMQRKYCSISRTAIDAYIAHSAPITTF
jgi:hypothetical protein